MTSATVDDLAARLYGLGDWQQRTAVFSEIIQDGSPELAACVFSELIVRTVQARQKKYTIALQAAFLASLTSRWSLEHRIHTREAAAAWQDELTLTFLVEGETEEDDEDFPVPMYNRDRALTLGERKTLAGSPGRRNIELALLDPHPAVIVRLLDNPRMTEPDVVRLAARTRIPRAILCELAVHPKWRERTGVMAALVQNRRLALGYGLTLLPFLDGPTLRSVHNDNRLSEELRMAASRLLGVAAQRLDCVNVPSSEMRH